ncbi:MAG: hypothetical protein FGM57_00445 [Candidatus Taylorbacteria bacterium]|nr:hypothetical protein [Candidatus Taylorbacteria bacterium]
MKQKTHILTSIFTLLIVFGLWAVRSSTPVIGNNSIISLQEALAQNEEDMVGDTTYTDWASAYDAMYGNDTDSSSDASCPNGTTEVCCSPFAENYIGRPLEDCEVCSENNSSCTFPSDTDSASGSDADSDSASGSDADSDSASASDPKTGRCCSEGNKNYKASLASDEYCDPFECIACPEYICCDQRATNYVPVSQRHNPDMDCTFDGSCNPPHTTCNSQQTCEYDNCDPSDPTCGPGCYATASCTVSNGIVSIRGEGTAFYPSETGCTEEDAQFEAEAACGALSPEMPLGTRITYSPFAYAIVTDVDVCSNLPGSQQQMPAGYSRDPNSNTCVTDEQACTSTGGTWVADKNTCVNPAPACGSASNLNNLNNPPVYNLCNPGNPSAVSTNVSNYTWTCTDQTNSLAVDCSAGRCSDPDGCITADYCTNIPDIQDAGYPAANSLYRTTDGECYPNDADLCSNIAGDQDAAYLDTRNLFRDEYGRCWDDDNRACGTAMNMLTWATPPQNNLCDPSSTASLVTTDETDMKYRWTCSDIDGHTVGTCAVNMLCSTSEKLCKGQCIPKTNTCLEVATTTLIQIFKVVPKVVPKVTDTCTLSWTVSNDFPDPEMPLTCTIDGVSITDFNSSKPVTPGVHRMSCSLGSEYQEKAARCEINPEYKEV